MKQQKRESDCPLKVHNLIFFLYDVQISRKVSLSTEAIKKNIQEALSDV